MGWGSAGHDPMHSRQQNECDMRFGHLKDAVSYCQAMGWGMDIQYPTNWRWHTRKVYAENFAWKGYPTAQEQYD